MYTSSVLNYTLINKAIRIESSITATGKEAFVIDWSQFVPTLIATFIAFCLTLFASYLYDNYRDSVQRTVFTHDVCKELKTMRDDLHVITNTMSNNSISTTWLNPLKTYIWDSLIDNNKAYLISNETWYGDLLAIYHMAREYNSWHMLRTEIIVQGRSNAEMDNGIVQLKEKLVNSIDSVLQIIKY